jgi:hypothetical protein
MCACRICYSLRKVLFIEKADQYYKIDNWPPESERKYYHFVDFLTINSKLLLF